MSTARWTRTGPLNAVVQPLRPSASMWAKMLRSARRRRPSAFRRYGSYHLVAQICRQHAPGREHGGHPREDHAPDLEPSRHVRDVEARGPAEGQEREAPGIHTATNRDQADALGHLRVDELVNAASRRHAVHCRVARRSRRPPTRQPPARASSRRPESLQDRDSPTPGSHRSRSRQCHPCRNRPAPVGPGARGPDMQDTSRVYPRDRASAGSDADDIEARQRYPMTGNARSTAN